MYDVVKPAKIQIYVNTANKTMEQIKRNLRCSHLINGGTFDAYGHPCCWLKADGAVLHKESWSDWGFGWNTGPDIRMDSSVNIGQYHNFISCVSLISPGALSYPKEMGGVRGRTAIGRTADGRMIPYCTQDGTADAKTPEQLQAEMRSIGATTALMLDGGISSRGVFPSGVVPTNPKRPWVQNYIAIWTGEVEEKPKPVCPYAEPTHNIRWGSMGAGAKWVQWMLNRNGAALDVDGLFFGKSVEALKKFQHNHGLAWDGVCGPLTREELAK